MHTTQLLTIGKSKNSSPLSRAAFCIILGDLGSDHFTILDGLALVLAVEVEVDFGVLNFPGAVLILEETVFFEGNFTVGRLPPAVFVLIDALSGPHPGCHSICETLRKCSSKLFLIISTR